MQNPESTVNILPLVAAANSLLPNVELRLDDDGDCVLSWGVNYGKPNFRASFINNSVIRVTKDGVDEGKAISISPEQPPTWDMLEKAIDELTK